MEQVSLIDVGKASGPYTVTFRLKTFTVKEADPARWKAGPAVRSAEDAFRLAKAIYNELDADKEHFVLLCLDNKNRLVGYKVVSTGSKTASIVHPREVFTAALFFHSVALICLHNHPAGDPAPSPEDIDITRRLKEIADIIGMRFLDHVVVGGSRYFSFSDKGML